MPPISMFMVTKQNKKAKQTKRAHVMNLILKRQKSVFNPAIRHFWITLVKVASVPRRDHTTWRGPVLTWTPLRAAEPLFVPTSLGPVSLPQSPANPCKAKALAPVSFVARFPRGLPTACEWVERRKRGAPKCALMRVAFKFSFCDGGLELACGASRLCGGAGRPPRGTAAHTLLGPEAAPRTWEELPLPVAGVLTWAHLPALQVVTGDWQGLRLSNSLTRMLEPRRHCLLEPPAVRRGRRPARTRPCAPFHRNCTTRPQGDLGLSQPDFTRHFWNLSFGGLWSFSFGQWVWKMEL